MKRLERRMKRLERRMKRPARRDVRSRARSVAAAALLAAALLFTGARLQWIAAIDEELELIGVAFRIATEQYVDDVRPAALLRGALTGMMTALDPYSVYIDSTDQSELDIITTGAYGGIGVTILQIDGRHVVSAFVNDDIRRGPLRIGDVLLSIDGASTAGMPSDALRRLLRGRPGTSLRLVLQRPGQPDSLQIAMVRRDVAVRIISSVDTIAGDLLIVKLERFPRQAGEDLFRALDSVRRRRPYNGLILDLRDNPGGMLEAAVAVSELFLPSGAPVVATRGNNGMQHRAYVSGQDPYLPDMPMVVLVNQGSASASEIVAGALQDHDRAVIVGEATFGKGLVQNIYPLARGGSMKLTTSRYFTPSGRCIQKTEYSANLTSEAAARVAADTQRSFRTLSTGRLVRGRGGIHPDVVVVPDTLSTIARSCVNQGVIRSFAAWYRNTAALEAPPRMNGEIRDAFFRFIHDGSDSSHVVLREFLRFRRQLSFQDEDEEFAGRMSAFSDDLRAYTDRALLRHWPELTRLLEQEFVLQLGSSEQYRKTQLRRDRQAAEAARILLDARRYRSLLGK